MSCYKYTISVLGAIAFSEIVFICLKKICCSVSKVYRDMTCDEIKPFSQVVFFPDQGIIRHDFNDELCGSVNNSPHTSIPKVDSRNVLTKNSQNNSHRCEVKIGIFSPPYTRSSLTSMTSNLLPSLSSSLKRSSSLIRLIEMLESARTSLMLCLHSLSCQDLVDAVLRAKTRGVHVRVLLDSEMCSESCERAMGILQHHNVFVRPSLPPRMMHHKFALIDALADGNYTAQSLERDGPETENLKKTFKHVMDTRKKCSKPGPPVEAFGKVSQEKKKTKSCGILMTGSFNWTWSAVISNHENVLITSHPVLIQHFTEEFESLWRRELHQESQQGHQHIDCDARSAVYFQAIFFPDQGILGSFSNNFSMADFGSVNNSPIPVDSPCPRVKEAEGTMKDSYLHKAKDISFNQPQYKASKMTNKTDVPHQYLSTLRQSTSLIEIVKVLDSAQESLLVCLHTLTCRDLINAVVRAQSRGVLVRVLVDGRMWSESCQKTMDVFQRHNVPFLPSLPPLMLHHKFAVIDAPSVSVAQPSAQAQAQDTGDKRVVSWRLRNVWLFGNVSRFMSQLRKPFKSQERVSGALRSIMSWRLMDIWNGFNVSQSLSQLSKPQKFHEKPTGVLITGSFNWTWSAVVSNHENVVITNDPVLVQHYAQEFESLWGSYDK